MNLGSKAVAYLNVDCAVQGSGFYATATPQLDNLLLEVTKKVEKLLLGTVREKVSKWFAVRGVNRLNTIFTALPDIWLALSHL